MNDATMSVEGDKGALPSLDGGGAVLGTPETKLKSKTNVGRFAVVGIIVAAFIFIIGGLLMWQKHRKEVAANEPDKAAKKADPMAKPAFMVKNTAVNSDSIEKVKAELKKREEEDAALKEAQDEAARQAKVEEAIKHGNPGAGQPGQYGGGTYGQQQPGAQTGAGGGAAPPVVTVAQRRLNGDALVDLSGGGGGADDDVQRQVQTRLKGLGVGGGAGAPPASPYAAAQGPAQASAGGQGGDGIGSRLQPTVLQARMAGKLPNLDFLLKRGMTVPCALETGIDTTLPGFVTCKAVNDVYSANGKTKIVEKGAVFFGEQQSSLKQGQARTFVVWSRFDNPSGIFANIDSPGTDQMGFNGIPGFVDSHFAQRFGGAIMLSLISDFSTAAAQRSTGQNGNQVQFNATSQAGQDMAAEALRNSINIPPTLIVNPATVINVMIARDVSFENVFTLVE